MGSLDPRYCYEVSHIGKSDILWALRNGLSWDLVDRKFEFIPRIYINHRKNCFSFQAESASMWSACFKVTIHVLRGWCHIKDSISLFTVGFQTFSVGSSEVGSGKRGPMLFGLYIASISASTLVTEDRSWLSLICQVICPLEYLVPLLGQMFSKAC